jgi:tRNA(fMet)-specific endonuclease VapC
MILLDSDHLSVLLDERDRRSALLEGRLDKTHDNVALPIVSVEEQLRGWLALIHGVQDPYRQIVPYLHLKKIITRLSDWLILEWDDFTAQEFQRLRSLKNRIGSQDLKIACIALANDALLLSANLHDFERVPGLRVED